MTRKLLASTILTAALSSGAAYAATTINTGGSSLAAPTYIAEYMLYDSKHTSSPQILFNYTADGSGAGQNGFLNNDITQFTNAPAGTLTFGTIVGTQVDIGASDAFLTASQPQFTNPSTGSYMSLINSSGSSVDGPLIQIPTFGTPITMAYNESGVSGDTLTLTDAQICGILSGEINDWHTLVPSIAAGTTINVVYRSDGSGTTFLTTQHLNKVCTSSNSTFPTYPVPVTKYFYSATATNNPVFSSPPPSNFTGESGSASVANQLVATSDSFGYLSPDFTSIAPKSANTNSLQVATLVNKNNGMAYLPTVMNTETGLANPGGSSTNATPPSTLPEAMDPLNWVPAIPTTLKGYPIVGYTTMELSTCYAVANAGTAINSFLTDQYNSAAYLTIIKNNGFSALANTAASPYVNKILHVFLGNQSGYNLNIDNATTCSSYAGR